jgi:hypothetical protein
VLLLYYICNYAVVFFFNSAIVACAVKRMQGEETTLAEGLSTALSRLPLILAWAVISATVGLVLRIIEDRSQKLGGIIAGILGVAWSVLTFLVVPVIVIEGEGPIQALRTSAESVGRTWGEQVVGSFSFGLVFFLLAIPGVAAIFAGVFLASATGVGIVLVAAALCYMLALAVISSVLAEIFRAAVYLYAAGRGSPAAFGPHLLRSAMGPRT